MINKGLSIIKALVNSIGMLYPSFLCKLEYDNQKNLNYNERPVEFSFLFSKILEIWPETILDVGTGKTSLPHMLRNCGFMVTAIDNISDYWSHGMVNRHYHVINDDIKSTKLQDTFDVITCVSVLEHITEHRTAMKSMYSLLNPGGYLILTCPYNDKQYVPNVYELDESNVKHTVDFVTQSFSSIERDTWLQDNQFTLVDEEYWHFFDGEFWTCGERLVKPKQVNKEESHQICCMLFRKNA